MLEITPCLDDKLLIAYCRKCDRLPGPAFYLYLAENRGEIQAAGLFEVESDRVNAVYYESIEREDAYLFDAVLRAGLNYAAGQGIPKGCLPEAFRDRHRELFAQLNYPPQSVFDITNFFSKYKNCT